MKKFLAIVAMVILGVSAFAQPPQKMSYQAVIRNNSNVLVTNHVIEMRISILQGSVSGTPAYVETQSPTTNENGLVSIEIGDGTVVSGSLAAINWSAGIFFIKTETDPTGGTNYAIIGISQLLSVPYSLYAKTSENIINVTFSFTGDTMFLGKNKIIIPGVSAANQLKDVDGNVYKTVKIGNQVWMVDNLKTTVYSDGSAIPFKPDNNDWSTLSTPAFCWYNNDETTYKSTYGALYNWFAVDGASNGGKNICPIGWHVPIESEWITLTDYLTNNGYGYEGSGNDIAKSMASISGWTSDPTIGNVGNDQASNNRSGFTALPGGTRYFGGGFDAIESHGFWWAATLYIDNLDNNAILGLRHQLYSGSKDVSGGPINRKTGYSVRCLKDN